MRRREFITLLGGAAAWPLATRAQQTEGMRRIGVLMGLPEDDPETKARAVKFRQELERLGWAEGRNVRIDTRFAPAGAQAQVLAKELVDLRPDVILAHSAQIAAALHRQTRTIPIVFVNVSDPIGAGFVDTLARPGGNLTGLLHYEEGIVGKWLALLKEIAPHLARAALVADPKSLRLLRALRKRRGGIACDRRCARPCRERRRHRARFRDQVKLIACAGQTSEPHTFETVVGLEMSKAQLMTLSTSALAVCCYDLPGPEHLSMAPSICYVGKQVYSRKSRSSWSAIGSMTDFRFAHPESEHRRGVRALPVRARK
jgi:hypothetical protein